MDKEKFLENLDKFIDVIEPYVNNFWKILFRMLKRNNLYILWFFVYFYLTFIMLRHSFGEQTFGLCVLFYLSSLSIAIMCGDTIFSIIEGTRILETKREKEYLEPIFEEVYQSAKETYPSLPKIKLHIIDSLTVNAIAIGRHIIAVTQGAVDTFSREELKGVMAHEIAHIYNGDTKAVILNTIGNGIFAIVVVIIKLVLLIWEYFSMAFESKLLQFIFSAVRIIFEMLVFYILWVGKFILSLNSRGNEFRADQFAFEVNYGEQLIESLYLVQKMSLGEKMNLIKRMQSSHPRTSKRIGRLEKFVDEEFENDQ